jgi:hypothetical protein
MNDGGDQPIAEVVVPPHRRHGRDATDDDLIGTPCTLGDRNIALGV